MAKTRDTLGRPMRDLRISLTDRCNLRCGYCMPADVFGPEYAFLPPDRVLGFEEIVRLARAFGRLGVEKIRLTGGEPLLRPKVNELVKMLKETGQFPDLAITTNGWFLAAQAEALAAAGLDRVTVSLDALSAEVAGEMNGRGWGPDKALDGIAAAVGAGLPVKVNMVVQRGVNDGEIVPMARYCRDLGVTLRFIEFMDVGNHNGWDREQVVPSAEILARLSAEADLEPVAASCRGEVATRYRYSGTGGEVGFISSVTAPFCRDCSRARLSADGRLFTCLFATAGMDLAAALRAGASDLELEAMIGGRWARRSDRYSELRSAVGEDKKSGKVEMSFIGG